LIAQLAFRKCGHDTPRFADGSFELVVGYRAAGQIRSKAALAFVAVAQQTPLHEPYGFACIGIAGWNLIRRQSKRQTKQSQGYDPHWNITAS
jgi:hypothetical protein